MARKLRRISDETAAVLRLFLADATREWFGLEIVKGAKIQSGSLYPILHRLEERGILISVWESQEVAVSEGRRPRCLYHLDPRGLELAEALLEEWLKAVGKVPADTPKRLPAWEPSHS